MTKRPVLGRGLSALIPTARTAPMAPPKEDGLLLVEVARLEPNDQQPRRLFDEAGIAELAQSIRASGILQPILVTRDGDHFRILAGERRLRAAKLAGLEKVPVVVRERLEDGDRLLLALVENVQRRDLTALEEAEAYRHLKDDFGMTQDQIAERVGKDRATVANAIRLLKLPERVRQAVEEGLLSAGHARALLALPSADDQEKLCREVIEKGLSVRLTEKRIQELMEGEPRKAGGPKPADPHTRDAEVRLQRALGTKVEIHRKRKGGEIRIVFYSEPELIGLFERIVGHGEEV